MNKILLILIIPLLFNSCKSEYKHKITGKYKNQKVVELNDSEGDFNEWLSKQDLNRKMIVDTTSMKIFELWAYKNKLIDSDSSLYWHPSKDSSYYLITNFNRKTNKRVNNKYYSDIELRFLKKESNEVFIGIGLLDSLKKLNIDFYWYDSTTFYFIKNEKGKEEKILNKLEMGIDSIWSYKIEK